MSLKLTFGAKPPQGIPFFAESVKLYEGLSQELGYNLLFNQMGGDWTWDTPSPLCTVCVCAPNSTASWELIVA